MSNNDKLAEEILDAGKKASDLAWQLPIWDIYKKYLDIVKRRAPLFFKVIID